MSKIYGSKSSDEHKLFGLKNQFFQNLNFRSLSKFKRRNLNLSKVKQRESLFANEPLWITLELSKL